MLTDNNSDEFTLEERKRVPQLLDFSLSYLKEIFQIPEVIVKSNLNFTLINHLFSLTREALRSEQRILQEVFPLVMTFDS